MEGGVTWTAVVLMVAVVIVMVDSSRRQERQAFKCGPLEPCTPLWSCVAFQDIFTKPTPELQRRIRQATCNLDRFNPKVCCPISGSNTPKPLVLSTTPTTPITPTPLSTPTPTNYSDGERLLLSACGVPSFQPNLLVVQGQDARLGELPWMALLGFDSTTRPIWGCGGTLITEQYVLTAAHCVHPYYTGGVNLTRVRLGEHNLGTEPDCEHVVCAPPPQDFTPAEVVFHPDFDKRRQVSDDIALVRLDRKVKLSAYVDPLCLPPADAGVMALLVGGKEVEVAGWGVTETGQGASILQKASLPFVNKTACNPHYNNTLLPEQVCFGGGAEDSCRGDSGGPLVLRDPSPLLVGIVSHGKDNTCGAQGIPAVYTFVTPYRTWITRHLRP